MSLLAEDHLRIIGIYFNIARNYLFNFQHFMKLSKK